MIFSPLFQAEPIPAFRALETAERTGHAPTGSKRREEAVRLARLYGTICDNGNVKRTAGNGLPKD